jgi:hypothetical protein
MEVPAYRGFTRNNRVYSIPKRLKRGYVMDLQQELNSLKRRIAEIEAEVSKNPEFEVTKSYRFFKIDGTCSGPFKCFYDCQAGPGVDNNLRNLVFAPHKSAGSDHLMFGARNTKRGWVEALKSHSIYKWDQVT